MAEQLSTKYPTVHVYYQEKPFVAAAVLEATLELETDVVIYMSADGETSPVYAPILVEKLIKSNADIVSSSRWIGGASFVDYGFAKLLISKLAQNLCKLVFKSDLTEYTYGYRAYKRSVLINCLFHEKKHPFFLESLLVPLRLGYKVEEIPVNWVSRREGTSVVNFLILLSYIRPIFMVRIRTKNSLLTSKDIFGP
jgi:dolichol-phosphate mannosyltransferase